MIEQMNTKLSNPELNELYDDFKEFGEDALEGYSMLHIRQLRKHILKKIENYEILQATYIMMNQPKDVEYKIVDSEPDQRALQIVNNMIRKGYKRTPEPENTSDEQTTAKTGFDFSEKEAALYLAYTGQQATTDEEAKKHLHLFKKLNTPQKLKTEFNRVRSASERKTLANSLNDEGRTKIKNHRKRIEKVMQHLNEVQKDDAQTDLDHITDITS